MSRKLLWTGICSLAFLSGCKKSDAEALANIGARIAERTQDMSDQARHKWTILPGRLTLENRVKYRLRWDKALAECTIEVSAQEQKVELTGTVPTADLVRRAVELTETTLGVDGVVNSLRVEGQQEPAGRQSPKGT